MGRPTQPTLGSATFGQVSLGLYERSSWSATGNTSVGSAPPWPLRQFLHQILPWFPSVMDCNPQDSINPLPPTPKLLLVTVIITGTESMLEHTGSVCVCVCVHVCTYVCVVRVCAIHVCSYVHASLCVCVCAHACVLICACVSVCVRVCVYVYRRKYSISNVHC